jgi:uncharacterized protein YjbJ (UPF0337 family)
MNEDILMGKWKQLKGKIKEQWGELTDDEIDKLEGRKDLLVGKLQERYGMSKDEASRQADNWWTRYAATP